MLSLNDMCILSYPFYLTSCILKSPQESRKHKFVEIGQMWYVIATVMFIDTCTLGFLPLVDSFKTLMILSACFSHTRTLSYDSSRYIMKNIRIQAVPLLKKVLTRAPFFQNIYTQMQDWFSNQSFAVPISVNISH